MYWMKQRDCERPQDGSSAAEAEPGDAPRARARRHLTLKIAGAGLALLASFAVAVPSALAALPDGRGWELVSPANKHGATIYPSSGGNEGLLGGLTQASEDGSALTYSATGPIEAEPESNRAPEGVQI